MMRGSLIGENGYQGSPAWVGENRAMERATCGIRIREQRQSITQADNTSVFPTNGA
jgi:hypothetical protein